MDAFDADVLIYSVGGDHPLGRRVRALFDIAPPGTAVGVGSVLLAPETLAKPMREGWDREFDALSSLLRRIDLHETTHQIAHLATAYAAQHRLRAGDAIHLATAVMAGASRFITNNSKDLPASFPDIAITFAHDLNDPG